MQADGTRVRHYGEKTVQMQTTGRNSVMMSGKFDVKGVSKPIMAAGSAVDAGHGGWLHRDGSMIVHGGISDAAHSLVTSKVGNSAVDLKRHRGIFVLPVKVDEAVICPLASEENALEDFATSEEARKASAKALPAFPSDEERQAHELHHLPFRSWCALCVAGRARDDVHKRGKGGEKSTIAVVSLDYCFLSRDDDLDVATVLVLNLRPHGACGAAQVVHKGANEFSVESVLHYLDLWGITDVVLKTDQEASIQALTAEVQKRREHPTTIELSPKGSHQSNGAAEQEVLRLEGLVGTII